MTVIDILLNILISETVDFIMLKVFGYRASAVNFLLVRAYGKMQVCLPNMGNNLEIARFSTLWIDPL